MFSYNSLTKVMNRPYLTHFHAHEPCRGYHSGPVMPSTTDAAPFLSICFLFYFLKVGLRSSVSKASLRPFLALSSTRTGEFGASPGRTKPSVRLTSSTPPTMPWSLFTSPSPWPSRNTSKSALRRKNRTSLRT